MKSINLMVGWIGMFLGLVSGIIAGLFFHKQDWLGGYSSRSRRMFRLGHIAFFGLGFVNVLFEFSMYLKPIEPTQRMWAGAGFLLALLTMSLVCFLTAWKEGFRHLFFIPVVGAACGFIAVIWGWW